LINAELGVEEAVIKRLNEIPQVKEIFAVYGVYDIITQLEAASIKELKDLISSKIRRIDGVRSTLTMIVMD
jgi:DNA-binding Lrp family transcriptional regulator